MEYIYKQGDLWEKLAVLLFSFEITFEIAS